MKSISYRLQARVRQLEARLNMSFWRTEVNEAARGLHDSEAQHLVQRLHEQFLGRSLHRPRTQNKQQNTCT
jgi:hypothetical protein